MNFQKEWLNITDEIHGEPECRTPYSRKIVLTRELLFLAQVILAQIELGKNVLFNGKVYQKIMSEYFRQKLVQTF